MGLNETDMYFFEELDKKIFFISQNVLLPVICCLGICGNTLSLCVLTRREMAGATMCFLTAMAVSDLLLLTIQVPAFFGINADVASMTSYKRFYQIYAIVRYGMSNIFITCTSWLTVVVATERFIFIRFFFHLWLVCTIRKARLAIIGIFIVSFVFHFSKFFEFTPNPDLDSTDVLVATSLILTPAYDTYVHAANIMISAIIPVFLLAVTGSFLIFFLVTHKRHILQYKTPASSSVDIAHVSAIVVATVLVFIMCHTVGIFLAVTSASKGRFWLFQRPLYRALITINNVLVMVNSSVNFILYCAISRKFQKNFIKMCRRLMSFKERDTVFRH